MNNEQNRTEQNRSKAPEIKCQLLLDGSFKGLDGCYRVYDSIFPALAARDYKEPRLVLEIYE